MRNLKRTLSLVLAAAMLIGMMVVSASAADFTDKADIDNTEAVDVMYALGVINGKGDGSTFDPDGTLTRAEAAKIVCYMLMGPTNAEKLGTTSATFTDVPTTHWAAPYINYCASLNILAGVGDGTFNPEGKLTGLTFGKMLLVALGYDATVEGYVGKDWATNIAIDMVDAGIDVAGIVLSDEISRDNACQMAFQTLTATMVNYPNGKGTNVTTPDGTTIAIGAGAAAPVGRTETTENYAGNVAGTAGIGTLQFCEKYFSTLKKYAGTPDAFNRPTTHGWFLDTNKDNTNNYVASTDKLVYTAAKTPALVTNATSTNDTLAKLVTANKLTVADGATYSYPQGGYTGAYADSKDYDLFTNYGACYVEFFTNTAGKVSNVVVYNYTLIKIDTITDLTAAQIKALTGADKGSTQSVKFLIAGGSNATIKDARFAGFNYAKGDYVLAVLDSNNYVLDSKPATIAEGKVDATKSSTYRIGDTFYGVATAQIGTVATPSIGDSGKWVVDADGKLAAAIDVSTKSANYAYVYRIVYTASGVDADGYTTASATVYAVLSDGTKVSYPAAMNADGKHVKGDATDGSTVFGDISSTSNNGSSTNKAVVAYSIVDGKFEVAASTDSILKTANTEDVSKTDAKITSTGSADFFCNDSTVFVFAKEDTNKLTVTTATGYKNVSITNKEVLFVANATSKAVLYAFVADANAYAASSSATVAVLLDATAVVTGAGTDADPTVYTYSVAVDGEVTELKLTSAQKTALDSALSSPAAGQVFSYTITDGTLSATLYSSSAKVNYVNGDQAQIGSDTKDLTGSAIYTVSYDKKTVTAGGSLTAESGKDGNTVILVDLNGSDGKIDYVFIMNEVDPEA